MRPLAQWESLARERLDAGAFGYYAGGATDELTLRENSEAFARRRFRPRVLVDVSAISLATTVLGRALSMPLGVAPMAYHHFAHPDAERATARAAAESGALFVASTMSTCSLEEIAAASTGPRWFQLYVHKDRAVTQQLVQRAEAAGYEALVLTVDLPIFGKRDRDQQNTFALPRHLLGNFRDLVKTPEERAVLIGGLHDPSLSWRDLSWLKAQSKLPLVLKGILHPDDARLAVQHGASAIVVSNHGGRQLDRAPASIDVLAEIVAAVDGKLEVYLDGGVRRGGDVACALALGARCVFVGRPCLYALAVEGEAGVREVFGRLREETENTMALLGAPNIAALASLG
jgi:isopentenyl diphosphate isomerase/L-lactate dehydrogenase-like FMN-dependent dehydrogenase